MSLPVVESFVQVGQRRRAEEDAFDAMHTRMEKHPWVHLSPPRTSLTLH
jgi:hypothetical protein